VAKTGALDKEETSNAYKALSSRSKNPQRRFTRGPAKKMVVKADHLNVPVPSSPVVLPAEHEGPPAIDKSEGASVAAKGLRVVSLAESGVVIQDETLIPYMPERATIDPPLKLKNARSRLTLPTAESAMLGAAVASAPVAQVKQVPRALPATINGKKNQPPAQRQAPRPAQPQGSTDTQPRAPGIPSLAASSVVAPEVVTALAGIVPAEVLADPARLPAYLQVLQDLLANGIPPKQWAQIIQGFHAQQQARGGAVDSQPQSQSKVPTSSSSNIMPVQAKETLGSTSSGISKAAGSIAYRRKRSASPMPKFIDPQRRLRFSDEGQAMYWPNSPAVSAKPVEKAKAVAEEAEKTDVQAPSVSNRMPRRRKANNVASLLPPVGHFSTQGSKRAPSPKHKRQTTVTEVIVISSSPSITPPSVRQKERLDLTVLEVPTIAGSSVAPMTFKAPPSNPTLPVSNATQDDVPTSQLSMSELRPLPPRETQVLTLFVTSNFVPGSGAYIEVDRLVDFRYPATEGSLQRISWNKFLESLPPGFCPDTSSATILISQPGGIRRHPVHDCNSLSYAIGDVRHFKPMCQQIAVHIASSKGEADLECARTLAEFAKGSR